MSEIYEINQISLIKLRIFNFVNRISFVHLSSPAHELSFHCQF